MSRHSKNNTASSVFTHGERKMIAKEYGTLKQRIGQDSQKPFDRCYICLQKVTDPRSCTDGHIFCNDCIIENLVSQKKKLELDLKEWERQQQVLSSRAKDEEENKKKKEIENFEKSQVDLRSTELDKKANPFNQEDKEGDDKKTLVRKIHTQEDYASKKPGMIKANFWMPENNQTLDKFMKEKPSSKMICPGDNKHSIKLKQLFKVQFDDINDKLYCWICKKELKFQKMSMLAKCGHVMCKTCLDLAGKKTAKCPVCSQAYGKEDVIEMKEAQSSHAAHNPVEAKKYTPAFTS